VTLWHLLTHTSGLAAWRPVYEAAGPVPVPPDQPEPVNRRVRWGRAVEALCNYPFVSNPGGDVLYSDLGLMLLGEVVRRLSGQDLDAAIAQHLTLPLGLAALTFNPLRPSQDRMRIVPTEDDPNWRGRRIWGEVHDENACGVGGVAGHAGLFAPARDVAVLGQAWLDGDERLGISPEVRQQATSEQAVMRRGLGWVLKAHEGANAGDLLSPNTYGHTGFTGTSMWIEPERQLVIVVLTNWVYMGRQTPGLYEFRRAVFDAVVRALI
jgi:serine-type D-Ala-D-Ala carboxypeptidase